jgi:hypothetical protein
MNPMSDPIDPELWVMRFLNGDELERFTNILETFEREQAWFAKWKSSAEPAPNTLLSTLPVKQQEELWGHMSRLEEAMEEKQAMMNKYVDQIPTWVELIDYSKAAIERLFDQGKFGRDIEPNEFWRLVYQQIASDRGSEIAKDPRFRNVKILEKLKEWATECLLGFAKDFREKGNPILAQVLEALADK